MRRITFSADGNLIDRARKIARGQNRTLNDAIREWLAKYADTKGDVEGLGALKAKSD